MCHFCLSEFGPFQYIYNFLASNIIEIEEVHEKNSSKRKTEENNQEIVGHRVRAESGQSEFEIGSQKGKQLFCQHSFRSFRNRIWQFYSLSILQVLKDISNNTNDVSKEKGKSKVSQFTYVPAQADTRLKLFVFISNL